ncbi:MAG: extracellular solute-binding protein [Rhodospirillales bacterium]|nr:extracellular solute-binding protein [Rhodospirillales bacterium]
MKRLDASKLDVNQITDGIRGGKYSRREIHSILGAFGFGMAVVPLTTGAHAQEEIPAESCGDDSAPLTFTWAGYDDVNLHKQYVEKYGCASNFAFWGDEEEAFAKMRAGFEPDVMTPCTYELRRWFDAGLLAPIDTDLLSNWDQIIPTLKEVDNSIQGGNRVFVPMEWGQTSVTFRTDLAPEYVDVENHTWGILWDEKYSGRLSMIDSLIDGVAVASIYGGVENPYDLSDSADMELTANLLREQLPLLRYYSNTMSDIEQSLASGELVAAATWNSSITALRNQGLPVMFMQPREGAMTWICGLVRHPANDANDEEMVIKAHNVIDSYISAEAGVWGIITLGYGHANQRAYEMVSEEELSARGLSKNPEDLLSTGIFQIEMTPKEDIQRMFEEVKAGM